MAKKLIYSCRIVSCLLCAMLFVASCSACGKQADGSVEEQPDGITDSGLDTITAVVGEGTSMHNLMLVNDGDTLCVVMDDSTVCNTNLVVGKLVSVALCERDGALAASVIDAGE